MKSAYGLLFVLIICTSSKEQKKTDLPKDKMRQHRSGLSESQLKEAANSPVPMSMVRNVRQARNEDILSASYVGVYRYDGKSFTNITRTIEWPTFWDVLEDQKGNLWFGTKDSGVYSFSGKTFLHYTTRQGLPSKTALHLFEDKAGNIWIVDSKHFAASSRQIWWKTRQ